ncbi:amidohydrolase family protein [Actinoplanes sp. TBRC 11911]|uniref:amidohydrolase family protein n=1 Tax=Actinoplanes sp. TBRC 11911 TaxID=2729386 RepID=UPI00145DD928|nr:amidohydrolase family protein [Actinoplanes sp. TBRC 11911]NMO52320.1 amidohydrolase family protein [Actinoplanes sp. TBRC 11911]
MAMDGARLFGRAYRRGVLDALPPPRRSVEGFRMRRGSRGLTAAAAAGEAFALRGAVITPDAAFDDGFVVVHGDTIAEVRRDAPAGVATVLDTGGVILPGLIDLHGHPEFNVFAAWEPPRRFGNRYQWRSSDIYRKLVRDPQNKLLTEVPAHTQLRYAEIRALTGGVTAIQGATGATRQEPLVRNVDLFVLGRQVARAMIDLPSSKNSRDFPRLQRILTGLGTGDIKAFYLHLCEGVRGDKRSTSEFERFLSFGAAVPGTVLIHASACDADQIRQLAAAGCKLVWSPQSNLRLYADTTLAAEALRAGMPVALGADWLPSGSTSLLAEMKVARRELARQGFPLAAADLVRMVTAGAAEVAGLADDLGSLLPGRPADILVLERHHPDPYENVALADPSWVELVLIGGDLSYARTDWYRDLALAGGAATVESVRAWGKEMTLDTGFRSTPQQPSPSLSAIRGLLTAAYPPVGPIYA